MRTCSDEVRLTRYATLILCAISILGVIGTLAAILAGWGWLAAAVFAATVLLLCCLLAARVRATRD